ncbi:MAG TPA: Hsp20/alpha crystallin family protein [Anaerolineales bacterium]|nr:Hsp20/alpha crystallin family protein [Anaerolineales bacterium]
MVDLCLKSDTQHPGWYISEDPQNALSEMPRWRIGARPYLWRPPTDVFETEDTIIVRVEIAGMRKSDFAISLIERSLTVRGVRQDTSERRAYHQMEIPFGEFSTEIDLPCPVIAEEVQAVYGDGFLRLILPKLPPSHTEDGS